MPDLIRNPRLGQVWTPRDIASRMVRTAMQFLQGRKKLAILDPAVGPFTFPQAIIDEGLQRRISSFAMFDIDPRMVAESKRISKSLPKEWAIQNQDYLLARGTDKYDFIVMNPPYVRQEGISQDKKRAYYETLEVQYESKIERRSNLFALFLLKSLVDVREGGIVCAIVYDAITTSRYGRQALSLMAKKSELLYSEHVSAPFGDVLIDAQIMIWKKCYPKDVKQGSPRFANNDSGRVPLSELMTVVRGFSLPYRNAFLVPPNARVSFETKKILIKQKDPNLFTCETTSTIVYDTTDIRARRYIKRRLRPGQDASKIDLVPKRRVGDICFNYYLRDKPRHLLNVKHVQVADNYYVCTVLGGFPVKAAWVLLNSDLYINAILSCGRNQGDGLIKLQAYEYKAVLLPDWRKLSQSQINKLVKVADHLLGSKLQYESFRRAASKVAQEVFQ